MSGLNEIVKIKFSKRMRVGRGIGSGKGKTSGRGVKGQKARSGVALKLFEGGQTPIYMRLPKKGFKSKVPVSYEVVNVKDVLRLAEKNGLKDTTITKSQMLDFGLIKNLDKKVKLILSNSEIEKKSLKIEADLYSKNAQNFSV